MDGSFPKGQARPALPAPLPPPPELPPLLDPESDPEVEPPEPDPELEGASVGVGLGAGALEVVAAGAVERGLQRFDEAARFFFAARAW